MTPNGFPNGWQLMFTIVSQPAGIPIHLRRQKATAAATRTTAGSAGSTAAGTGAPRHPRAAA